MGIPEYEAKRYEGRIRNGGILLSVHCGDSMMVNRAKDMLRHTGAQDIAAGEEGKVPAANRDTRVREARMPDRPLVDSDVPDTRRVVRDPADRTDVPPRDEIL
jgi:hypothetical protein